VLTELTMPEALMFGNSSNPFANPFENPFEALENRSSGRTDTSSSSSSGTSGNFMLQDVSALTKSSAPIGSPDKSKQVQGEMVEYDAKGISGGGTPSDASRSIGKEKDRGLLGDLPSLNKITPGKNGTDRHMDADMASALQGSNSRDASDEYASPSEYY
jgi:hypothetical protein